MNNKDKFENGVLRADGMNDRYDNSDDNGIMKSRRLNHLLWNISAKADRLPVDMFSGLKDVPVMEKIKMLTSVKVVKI